MLISKDENITSSVVYLGFLILKELKTKNKLSIFDITQTLKKNSSVNYRQLTFSLMFIFSSGVIDVKSPYIYKI